MTRDMNEDIEKVVFSEEELKKRIAELGKEITEDYKDAEETIYCVGILKGFDFMIASSYGNGTETSGTVKILKDLDYDVAGKHLIIIEDIIDSGTTMNYLMKYFRERKPKSVKLCALLSKPSRRTVDVNIDYCGYTVPDEFLVGYGLDYAEKYRNLPYIGVLKPEIYE